MRVESLGFRVARACFGVYGLYGSISYVFLGLSVPKRGDYFKVCSFVVRGLGLGVVGVGSRVPPNVEL